MRRFTTAALLLLASAACGSGSDERAPIPVGDYQLARVNDTPLPTPAPTEPNVTLVGGGLSLQSDSSYTMRLDANVPSVSGPQSREATGRYRAAGDTLMLVPAQGSDAAAVRFQFTVEGEELRLRDYEGHRYTFTRQ